MVTVLYFWILPTKSLPFALIRMALDRGALRKTDGVEFGKLLGCGKGETFLPSDVDINRWGLLATIEENQLAFLDSSQLVQRWRNHSTKEFRIVLDPISSHGKWSKREPFVPNVPANFDGQIAAVTRARIAWRQNLKFWKAVPPVSKSLHSAEGLIAAFGIGEAPIGLQGTFSLWQSSSALRNFAYKSQAHKDVIEATERNKWFPEELFARFAVRDVRGSL